MKLLLSIVIANYNYGHFLDEAIQSVLSQVGEGRDQVPPGEVELIIIDGGSTDNSVEVIRKYAGELPSGVQRGNPSIVDLHLPPTPITYWVSEKDKGQSNAFNKGFSKASGRFLTWLNADDVMLPGTLKKLEMAVNKYPECEWFVGGVMWLTKDMRVIRCGRGRHMSRVRAEHGQVNVCGPSSFFSRELYERAGRIDERHHYTMDTDLWLRFALNEKLSFKPFTRYAWGLRLHEDAKMSGHNFNPDGTLATNAFTDEALYKNEKKRLQLEKEDAWTKEKLPPLKGKLGRLKSLLCADCIPALMSRFDTQRVADRHYLKAMEVVG